MPFPLQVIGINLGTSKLLVASTDEQTGPRCQETTLSERCDPSCWLACLDAALTTVLSSNKPPLIACCGTSGSFLFTDQFGNAIGQSNLYNAAATAKQASPSRSSLFCASMHPIVATFKMFSVDDRARVRWVLPESVWLALWMCKGTARRWDNVTCDEGNARRLGLGSPHLRQELLDNGVPVEILPAVVPSGETVGIAENLRPRARYLASALVVHGTTDGIAEALGLLGDADDGLAMIAGSTTSVKGLVPRMSLATAADAYFTPHPIVADRAFFNAWVTVGENIRLLALRDHRSPQSLVAEALGDRPPFPLIRLDRHVVVRNEFRESSAAVCRGVMLSAVAWESLRIQDFERLRGSPIECVRMVGGTCRSASWTQLRANFFRRRVVVYRSFTTLGCALPAIVRKGLGNLPDFFAQCRQVENVVEPMPLTPQAQQSFEGVLSLYQGGAHGGS